MITLHHLDNSRSQRILWLMEELNIPYQIKTYKRNKKTMLAPPELKKIHPLGKSPVLTDGETVLAESGAIIEYLMRKYSNGTLAPSNEEETQRYTYWLHYAEGSLMPFLLLALIFKTVETKSPFFIRPIARAIAENVRKLFISPNLVTHFDYLENELTRHQWFAGSKFTAADIQMSFPLEAAEARGILKDRPNLTSFLKHIRNRPAYQKAQERGGSYSLLS